MEQAALIQLVIAVATILVSLGTTYGLLTSAQKSQGARLDKAEMRIDKLEDVIVVLARQGERLNYMDERMLAQGRRVDDTTSLINSVATLVTGRLDAINNIVAGHTSELRDLSRAKS